MLVLEQYFRSQAPCRGTGMPNFESHSRVNANFQEPCHLCATTVDPDTYLEAQRAITHISSAHGYGLQGSSTIKSSEECLNTRKSTSRWGWCHLCLAKNQITSLPFETDGWRQSLWEEKEAHLGKALLVMRNVEKLY